MRQNKRQEGRLFNRLAMPYHGIIYKYITLRVPGTYLITTTFGADTDILGWGIQNHTRPKTISRFFKFCHTSKTPTIGKIFGENMHPYRWGWYPSNGGRRKFTTRGPNATLQ